MCANRSKIMFACGMYHFDRASLLRTDSLVFVGLQYSPIDPLALLRLRGSTSTDRPSDRLSRNQEGISADLSQGLGCPRVNADTVALPYTSLWLRSGVPCSLLRLLPCRAACLSAKRTSRSLSRAAASSCRATKPGPSNSSAGTRGRGASSLPGTQRTEQLRRTGPLSNIFRMFDVCMRNVFAHLTSTRLLASIGCTFP